MYVKNNNVFISHTFLEKQEMENNPSSVVSLIFASIWVTLFYIYFILFFIIKNCEILHFWHVLPWYNVKMTQITNYQTILTFCNR